MMIFFALSPFEKKENTYKRSEPELVIVYYSVLSIGLWTI